MSNGRSPARRGTAGGWIVTAFILCALAGGGAAQLFENSTFFYQDMTMDMDVRHRGSYKLGSCTRTLMTCWEIARPNLVCYSRWAGEWLERYYESVCGLMRDYCVNIYGVMEPEGRGWWASQTFALYDSLCLNYRQGETL